MNVMENDFLVQLKNAVQEINTLPGIQLNFAVGQDDNGDNSCDRKYNNKIIRATHMRFQLTPELLHLYEKAKNQFEENSNRLDSLAKQEEEMEHKKSKLSSQEKNIEDEINGMDAELKGLYIVIEKLSEELYQVEKELEDCQIRIDRANKKARQLKKYFWVPGYSTYLLVDFMSQKDVYHFKSLQNKRNNLCCNIDRTKRNLEDYIRNQEETCSQKESIVAEKNTVTMELYKIIDEINICKAQYSLWQNILAQYDVLKDPKSNRMQIQEVLDAITNMYISVHEFKEDETYAFTMTGDEIEGTLSAGAFFLGKPMYVYKENENQEYIAKEYADGDIYGVRNIEFKKYDDKYDEIRVTVQLDKSSDYGKIEMVIDTDKSSYEISADLSKKIKCASNFNSTCSCLFHSNNEVIHRITWHWS